MPASEIDFRFLIYISKNMYLKKSNFFDAPKLDKFPIMHHGV